jgi:hypothetical protein
LFFDELPCPSIIVGLTPHGGCLGMTYSPRYSVAPRIVLHQSLWRGTQKENPWKVPPDLLGPRFALDTLIHECIHVSANYRLGGGIGESSHNNPQWIGEVNRIAPLIGLHDVKAAMSKPKRKGAQVQRCCDGNITFDQASRFPRAVRMARGEHGYYRDRSPLRSRIVTHYHALH